MQKEWRVKRQTQERGLVVGISPKGPSASLGRL